MKLNLLWLSLCCGVALAAVPPNSVWINAARTPQVQRPVTISRFFAQGTIPKFAQAVVSGTPQLTQCDVKTRWPDGSLQHALVSFATDLAVDNTVEVGFINQPTGNNEGPLDLPAMLGFAAGAWGARLEASAGGSTASLDVREMLKAGSFRYWMSGPLVTQVIVEGPSSSPEELFRHDFGWRCTANCVQPYDSAVWERTDDVSFQSLHPIFVLTFYAGKPGVRVEYIVENMWSTKLQDLVYDVSLFAGTPEQSVYSHRKLAHLAKTRWRKVFWSGTPLPDWDSEAQPGLIVNYNLPYLIYSRVLPNYDTTLKISESAIQVEVRDLAQKVTVGEEPQFCTGRAYCGQWLRYFNTGGGRGDIAVVPRWYLRYLYTFDPRLYGTMIQNSLVSGAVPIHVRESSASLKFMKSGDVPALGRPLSVEARPTVQTLGPGSDTRPEDRMKPVGTVSCFAALDFACTAYNPNEVWHDGTINNWKVDLAHQPGMAFVPYLITGEWYYLEELFFWSSYNAASGIPSAMCNEYCRHSDWGYVDWPAARAEAWSMRNLAHAALFAPTSTPERAYYSRLMDTAIAGREGRLDIRDGSFFEPNPGGTPEDPCPAASYDPVAATRWCWGYVTLGTRLPNPLKFINAGSLAWNGVTSELASTTDSIWMHHYFRVVMGHVRELGFPIQRLQEVFGLPLIQQLQDSSYNPYLAADYMYLVKGKDGTFASSWAEVRRAFITKSPLKKPISATDTTFDIVHISGSSADGIRLELVQTVRIDDELIRICSTALIFENESYTGTRVQVCAKGRGWNGTVPAEHQAGVMMARTLDEFPTIHTSSAESGYAYLARAAVSFDIGLSCLDSDGVTTITGQGAWDWINGATAPFQSVLRDNPMWAIIPRNDEALASRPFRGGTLQVVLPGNAPKSRIPQKLAGKKF